MFISDHAEHFTHRKVIAEIALDHRLPSLHSLGSYVDFGGLMEHATDLTDVYRQCASSIIRIFKGEAPGQIPFYQPTVFRLRVNLKVAKTLGVQVPPSVLAEADEVIE